jgi:hypothetical protein
VNYNTLLFIKDLKHELTKVTPPEPLFRGKLTDEQLSIVLGQAKSHIKKKRDQIRNNPDYLIPLDVLRQYINNLFCCYGDKAQKAINLIRRYSKLNNVPKAIYGVHRFHPNLKIDYFKKINSKEKAYWLGWLYAEGWLSRHDNYIRFGVELHQDDEEDLLIKFANAIGFNLEYKDDEIRRDGELTDYVRIRFVSDDFALYLINHGFIVGKEKSKGIELPDLDSREFYLAFVLGYYDGDGKVGTTIITSGSNRFIQQVKQHFEIPYKIWRTDSEWGGVGFNIYLGMDLMREMLANYKNSLPRKRIHFKK